MNTGLNNLPPGCRLADIGGFTRTPIIEDYIEPIGDFCSCGKAIPHDRVRCAECQAKNDEWFATNSFFAKDFAAGERVELEAQAARRYFRAINAGVHSAEALRTYRSELDRIGKRFAAR